MNMGHLLLVFVGGGAGAAARYGFGLGAGRILGIAFPFGTLGVNILGSLLMGLLIGWLAGRGGVFGLGHENARLLVATGFLGGFTTFSAFSLDVAVLYERGQIGLAAVYLGLSLALSIGALFAGLAVSRSFA